MDSPVYGELINGTVIPCVCCSGYNAVIRHLVMLFFHVIVTITRLFGPGGLRAVVAMFLFLIRSWNGSSGPFAVNIWTERYSGRPLISQTSCSNSGITTTATALITHCGGERQIRTREHQGRSQISAPTDGNPTAVACIRHPWLPDIPQTPVCYYAG